MSLIRWPLVAAAAFLFSQTPSTPEPSCKQTVSNNPTFNRTLANGATVAVGPADTNNLGQGCAVFVRDRTGKVIFEDRGFSTTIEASTGRDIDNDGQPDAVVGVETNGGTSSNWEYPVISFAPSTRVLLKLPHATFDFATKPGKTLIWTSATFDELGRSGPDTPAVSTVHEFRPNGFIDVTPDYCRPLLSGEFSGPGNLKGPLAILTRQARQDSRTEAGEREDREDTRIAATTVILQQIYCGQLEDASRLVLEVWPGSQQSTVRRRIKDAVTDRWSDLGRQLASWN